MQRICPGRRCPLALFVLEVACLAGPLAAEDAKPKSATLAVVNGAAITENHLQTMMAFREVPPSLHKSVRGIFLQRLIDNHLMRTFLDERKQTVPKDLLDRGVKRIYDRIRKRGGKPEDELKRRGLTDAALRRELALPIAWNLYARKIIGDREIRERFRKRPFEFDGTRVHARQIVFKPPKNALEKLQALQKLAGIRREILTGKIMFADAAKKHSTSPSKAGGGDIGEFLFRGKMPLEITRVAFALKSREVSRPFVTRYGVHLLQVTKILPGQLSLEDARPEIFRQLATERWNQQVAELRKTAKITISGNRSHGKKSGAEN